MGAVASGTGAGADAAAGSVDSMETPAWLAAGTGGGGAGCFFPQPATSNANAARLAKQLFMRKNFDVLAPLIIQAVGNPAGIRVVDGDGKVLSFVNIFVDNEDVRFLRGLETPLQEDAEVAIIPAMAGGQ